MRFEPGMRYHEAAKRAEAVVPAVMPETQIKTTTYATKWEDDRTDPQFVTCCSCGAELTITDWATLPEAPVVNAAEVRVCPCGAWLEPRWEVVT